MTKALTSFGQVGKNDIHWNECDSGELVGTFAKICRKEDEECCECGCRISFFGMETYRKTTQAVVISLEDWKLQNILHRFYDRLKKENQDVSYCRKHMEWLLGQLWKFQEGQILMRDTYSYLEHGQLQYRPLIIPNGFDHSYVRRRENED